MLDTYTPPAVKEIMGQYTPVEVKPLVHHHDESNFVHHHSPEDIISFYKEYNEDIHHWLVDDTSAYEFYAQAQHAYHRAQAECNTEDDRFAVQTLYIKDIVYLFIATVCHDLAQSHDLLHKTMQEVEDWQLSIDLEHRKNQLTVIDGGKS